MFFFEVVGFEAGLGIADFLGIGSAVVTGGRPARVGRGRRVRCPNLVSSGVEKGVKLRKRRVWQINGDGFILADLALSPFRIVGGLLEDFLGMTVHREFGSGDCEGRSFFPYIKN